MIALFVSAAAVFLGFLFLKDENGKETMPSALKLVFYFNLLLIVGIFFYKTNQVITIYFFCQYRELSLVFRQGKYATGCRFYIRDKDYKFFLF